MSRLDGSIREVRRRVGAVLYAGELARQGAIALFAVGSIALVARVAFSIGVDRMAPIYGLLLLVPLTSWLRVRRRTISDATAATWLDVETGASGLLVTHEETRDSRWTGPAEQQASRPVRLPRASWRVHAARVAPAALFAAVPFLLAIVAPHVAGSAPSYDSALERLREKLDTLEEVVDLDEAEESALEEDLARLDEQVDGVRPEVAFEALDRLEERIDERAAEAHEMAAEAGRDLEQVASAGQAGDPGDVADALEETMESLLNAGLIDEATELADLFDRETLGELGEAIASLSTDEAQALSDELLEMLRAKMAELADAGLGAAPSGIEPVPFDPAALTSLLAANPAVELQPACLDPDCDHAGG